MFGVEKITVTEDVALITFENMVSDAKAISLIFESFAGADINVDMISQTAPYRNHISLSFTVSNSDFSKALKVFTSLRETSVGVKPLINTSNTKLSLYGKEMAEIPGVASKAFSAVSEAAGQISLITTSEFDISLLVSNEYAQTALQALNKTFAME